MVTCFYDTVLPLLNHFMPWVERARYSTDKPWVTSHFRKVIKRRQQALEQGHHSEYKSLRNKTPAVGRSLRRRFYQSKVDQLHYSDPRSWWKHTKSFLTLNNSSKQSSFSHLQSSSEDCLPEVINKFLVSVSSHLSPVIFVPPSPACTTVRVTGYPCSQWLFLKGGMPQGSLLGPISFIIHIDDLQLLYCVIYSSMSTTLRCQTLLALIPPYHTCSLFWISY